MSFLLDTTVVSEWVKPRPNTGVVSWLAAIDEDQACLSVVTITELRYGIERLPAGARRKRVDDWLERDLLARFDARILPIDFIVANQCGRLVARSESLGQPMEPRDAFIGATAEAYGLTLVTRNTSHFQPALKAVFSPWT